jgi:hypothetical protein
MSRIRARRRGKHMNRLRILAGVTLAAALLVLAAAPAFAELRANVNWTRTPTWQRGGTLVSVYAICDDRQTADPLSADAEVVVTLTQGNRTVTKTETFTCFGDMPDAVTFAFRGFHPGDASIEMELTACDQDHYCTGAGFSATGFTLLRS